MFVFFRQRLLINCLLISTLIITNASCTKKEIPNPDPRPSRSTTFTSLQSDYAMESYVGVYEDVRELLDAGDADFFIVLAQRHEGLLDNIFTAIIIKGDKRTFVELYDLCVPFIRDAEMLNTLSCMHILAQDNWYNLKKMEICYQLNPDKCAMEACYKPSYGTKAGVRNCYKTLYD